MQGGKCLGNIERCIYTVMEHIMTWPWSLRNEFLEKPERRFLRALREQWEVTLRKEMMSLHRKNSEQKYGGESQPSSCGRKAWQKSVCWRSLISQ